MHPKGPSGLRLPKPVLLVARSSDHSISTKRSSDWWVGWWVENADPYKSGLFIGHIETDGGQGGIRTRGGCYTTHAFQACALNHSATCPFSAVGRSYSAVDRLGNGIFPRRSRLARVHAAIWGIDGGVSGLGVVAAGVGRCSDRARWADLVERRLLPFAGLGRPVVASRCALARRYAERDSASSVGRS